MGIGGNTVGMGLFTLSTNYKKHQSAVVGIFTANWNASPIVLLLFSVLLATKIKTPPTIKVLYMYVDVPYKALFLGYLVVPGFLILLTVFWPGTHKVPNTMEDAATQVCEEDITHLPSMDYISLEEVIGTDQGLPTPQIPPYKSISALSHIRTPAFILATIFLAGEALFVNTFIGTVSYQAQHFAMPQLAETLIYVFGIMFPVGQLVCAPLVIVALEKSILGSYIVAAACGILLGIVSFLEQCHWSLLVVNFVIFSLWRSFLYCTTWAFITKKYVLQP